MRSPRRRQLTGSEMLAVRLFERVTQFRVQIYHVIRKSAEVLADRIEPNNISNEIPPNSIKFPQQ